MKNCENIEKLQSRKNITCLELSNHQTWFKITQQRIIS
jgi:hypothetical protein